MHDGEKLRSLHFLDHLSICHKTLKGCPDAKLVAVVRSTSRISCVARSCR